MERLIPHLSRLHSETKLADITDVIIQQDMRYASAFLPASFVDMLFLDPPYNLTKEFNGTQFKKCSQAQYAALLDEWVQAILHTLKPCATIYICGDWQNSAAIYEVASRYFQIRNRITWEREKGRGALRNWKNCSEDIWFCTLADDYYFNAEAVKLKRKVLAPYRDKSGVAKDWQESENGKFRLTSPSNLMTDITIPFWSMPENTDHPTQKPEKLLAKLILASSQAGDIIFDPFLGSGTTAVVAQKLARHYVGIEREQKYACTALHRLEMAANCTAIQGYDDSVFWERNSTQTPKKAQKNTPASFAETKSMLDLTGDRPNA